MIYVNQSWKKKKKSSLQCWIVYSSSLPKKCGIQMIHTPHPSGEKKKGTQAFNDRRDRREVQRHWYSAWYPCSPLSSPKIWVVPTETINSDKNANSMIIWKVLQFTCPRCIRSFQNRSLNIRNEYSFQY